ncbi:hypothetical protein DM02DRAFT_611201 [Periconia macrospinosa]|uniref:Uncharacterized protein n=1 Tax=Periconia macrospinosa TaxID=97972 RepID=A0A2V1E2Q0_9PLEO|nr:hypothetical protein DM02DRAFT_611201 [Periconia macrospinosa]
MSAHRAAYKRQALDQPLLGRQATTQPAASSSAASFPTPTNRVVLSTAFEGPSTCSQNLLTMLPPPSYQIWANEPVPAANLTIAACHATEFLQSYTAVMVGTAPSSIVPVMTNFACPKNYCTALASARNYVVCCPSNYLFHPPDSTVDSNRPFYGGTCYSDMTSGSSYPLVQYNTNGDTASSLFPVTTTNVQAFAHPIDGFAATSPTNLGCSAPASKSSSASALNVDTSASASGPSNSAIPVAAPSSTTSPGVIAGAVVASILGLAAIVGLVFFLLAYRRKHGSSPPPPPPKELGEGRGFHNGGIMFPEMGATPSSAAPYQLGEWGDEKSVTYASRVGVSEVNGGHGAYEMATDHAVEMDAAAGGPKWKDEKR